MALTTAHPNNLGIKFKGKTTREKKPRPAKATADVQALRKRGLISDKAINRMGKDK